MHSLDSLVPSPVPSLVPSLLPSLLLSLRVQSIVTAYVPVFMYTYAFLAVITPLVFLTLASLPPRALPPGLRKGLVGILRPQDYDNPTRTGGGRSDFGAGSGNGSGSGSGISTGTRTGSGSHVGPGTGPGSGADSGISRDGRDSFGADEEKMQRFQKQLIHANSIMAQSVQHLVVLLTFGLCCPPLGCVVLLTVCTNTFTWETLITRFVLHHDKIILSDFFESSAADGSFAHEGNEGMWTTTEALASSSSTSDRSSCQNTTVRTVRTQGDDSTGTNCTQRDSWDAMPPKGVALRLALLEQNLAGKT